MKLSYLKVDGYKNLNDMTICINKDSSVYALVGNNGSGKSNILEVITRIFGSVYAGIKESFNYELRYEINEEEYTLKQWDGEFSFTRGEKKIPKKSYREAFPKGLYLYYCGETKRLEKISNSYVDSLFDKAVRKDYEYVTKYISYLSLEDCASAILSNAVYKSTTFEKICDLLDIDGIGNKVIFKIKNPNWGKRSTLTEESFWNAQGATAYLLEQLKKFGQFNIVDKDNGTITIDEMSSLKTIWECESECDLFVKCKLLAQQGILEEIVLHALKDNQEIKIEDLSEGEKQLAELLCILDATKEYKALFLLDEFDSYLHPKWQRRFAEIMSDIEIRGQVLFTTHSPITIGKMESENIAILKDGKVYKPATDTMNRDITEILEEVMGVGKRPIEVEKTIKDLKNAIMRKDKEDAEKQFELLETLLSEGDPFWITANHLKRRMER